MTYYEDLSPYEYFENEPLGVKAINVGWLGEGELFPTGETSQEFKAKLFEFCLDEYVVSIARGFHMCEFCDVSVEEWYEQSNTRYGEKAHWLNIGTGEIRVIGQSALYAAPTLIYHYVVEHNYNPPDEFIEAVLSGPPPGSKEHETLLKKYNEF
jgi:hypothetical protein